MIQGHFFKNIVSECQNLRTTHHCIKVYEIYKNIWKLKIWTKLITKIIVLPIKLFNLIMTSNAKKKGVIANRNLLIRPVRILSLMTKHWIQTFHNTTLNASHSRWNFKTYHEIYNRIFFKKSVTNGQGNKQKNKSKGIN